jgi:hypothetical protein
MRGKISFFLVVLAAFFSLIAPVHAREQQPAANFIFSASLNQNSSTPTLQLDVSVDASEAVINTVSGEIGVPEGLRLRSVDAKQGVVDVWILEPAIAERGLLQFAGIMTHGYGGTYGPYSQVPTPGLLFRATFDVLDVERAELNVHDVEALLHDGFGTPVSVSIQSNSVYANVSQVNQGMTSEHASLVRSGMILLLCGGVFYLGWRLRR